MSFCPCDLVLRALRLPTSIILMALAGIGALCTAFIAQYFFDVAPCVLCWWQRLPYALVALAAGGALAFQARPAVRRGVLVFCALAFLGGMGTALFHSGVERHLWRGTEGCEVKPIDAAEMERLKNDIEALRKAMLAKPAVSCEDINWSLFGLTMANWNVLASLGLAAFAALAASGLADKISSCSGSSCCLRRKKDQDSSSASQ